VIMGRCQVMNGYFRMDGVTGSGTSGHGIKVWLNHKPASGFNAVIVFPNGSVSPRELHHIEPVPYKAVFRFHLVRFLPTGQKLWLPRSTLAGPLQKPNKTAVYRQTASHFSQLIAHALETGDRLSRFLTFFFLGAKHSGQHPQVVRQHGPGHFPFARLESFVA